MTNELAIRILTGDVLGTSEQTQEAVKMAVKALSSAQPERLTDDDFETIRIHLNACKEKLCNQRRWKEAEEYQHIIDRFMAFASAEPEKRTDKRAETHACDLIDSGCMKNSRDLIDRAEAQTELQFTARRYTVAHEAHGEGRVVWSDNLISLTDAMNALRKMPPAEAEPKWIPIKWHNCTNEDREKYGFSDDIVAVFDNEMPDDNQEILITTSHGYVEKDICYIDECFSLDSGYDWIYDVKAWKPLPAPYREDGEKNG